MAFSPPIDLNHHCTVIDGSTLYAYSPDGFQSLDLTEGASWKKLESGVSVDGAQCVHAVPGGNADEAGLFVVGGVPTNNPKHTGLQKFTFSTGKWETITPDPPDVIQNLHGHGAAFLNSTSQILTYAGSANPNQDPILSSSTFAISVVPPFKALSFEGPPAPPLVYPLVLPLNETNAVMVGGDSTSKGVFTFEPTNGWADLGVTLPSPIADQTTTQCTVMSGDDGSKVLETYNLGVEPNLVTRQALVGSQGTPVTKAEIIAPPRSNKRKRDLTLGNWPKYNDTQAPAVSRSGYSIAADANGLTVISGGDPDVPLAIFDQRANSWEDPSAIFGSQDVSISSNPSSTASTPSATSGSPATTSSAAAAPPSDDSSDQDAMLTVLGATLGSIFGVAAILVIILLILRWRREKNKRKYQNEAYANEKDRLSFADRGDDEFMKETGGFLPEYHPLPRDDRTRSSAAMFSGSTHKRGVGGLGSDSSTMGLMNKAGPLGYNDPVELSRMDHPEQPLIGRPPPAALNTQAHRDNNGRSRSSGWSRYFANNETTNLAQIGPERSTFVSDHTSATNSMYTDSRPISHPSQEVPPLDLSFAKFDGSGSLNRVASNSPTLGHSREDVQNAGMAVSNGMKAELSRARSTSTVSSTRSRDQETHDMAHTKGESGWTPMPRSEWNRPPSSIYTESARGSRVPGERTAASSFYTNAMPSYYRGNEPGRDSTVTVFPRGVPSYDPNDKSRQTANTDMSWLNLGHNNNH